MLTDRLREHVRDPQVSVTLQDARSYRVYVIGEVLRPGEFEVKGPVGVVQAIAMAGGFTPFATRTNVVIVGRGAPERRRAFDYDAFVAGSAGARDLVLAPGDTVVVR
jgi:polysaccharide export outer membrane protein